MPFKIWDNHFGAYMRNLDDGNTAEFDAKVDADRAIEKYIRARDRQEEWLPRLNIEHHASNLCYHLTPVYRAGELLYFRPSLLPIDYRVPKCHWKLFNENGDELRVGLAVRTWRGEEVELIDLTPPHRMSSFGEVTCVDSRGRKNWWYPSVIGGAYRYVPPENNVNAVAVRWASVEKWEPPKPFDIPPAREILLPRPIWELPREESAP